MRADGEEEREMMRVGEIVPFHVFAAEILHRLPAEELEKFKSVCRDWLKLISSPVFTRVHLEWGIGRIRVLIPNESDIVECNSGEETKRIPYPPHLSSSNRIITMGSCDGLLCLLGASDRKIAVFNPWTRKYFGMQIAVSQGTYIRFYWFGCVDGKYLLVLGYGHPHRMEVYSFSNGSEFELIQSFYFDRYLPRPSLFSDYTDRGLFFNGAVHWPAQFFDDHSNDKYGAIFAFHLEQNNWFKISLPRHFQECGYKDGFTLGVSDDQCLFVIFKPIPGVSRFELWIMKEYGVQQSWTMWAHMDDLDEYRFLYPLGFLPNGDLILDALVKDYHDLKERHLIQYNFNDYKLLQRYDCYIGFEAIICADSLLSPTTVLAS